MLRFDRKQQNFVKQLSFNKKIENFLKSKISFVIAKLAFLKHQNLLSMEDALKCWLLIVSVKVTQLCLTLWDPMDCSPPGFSVLGILQARTLE